MKSIIRRGESPPSALTIVGPSGVQEDVAGGTLRKLLLGLALLALACAGLLALAEPGWAQSGAAPPNDDFADAQEIRGDSVDGTTAGATRETGEPDHYTSNPADADSWEGDHSVWYRWTAPVSGPKTIDTCTTNIDSILAVYTGDSLSGLDRVADNNNDYCGGGWGSKVTFDATAGTTYQIAVSDAGGLRENTFTLAVGDPEADLEVYKYSPGSAFEGELFSYDISVNNNGPTTATNVTIEDTLPDGLDFVRTSDDRCSYDEDARKVSCDLGNISAGGGGGEFSASASDGVSFEVRPTEEGTLQNTAAVSSDVPDPEAANDQSTATTEVVPRPDPPDSIINDPGCQANTLSRNDDGSTGAVDLPFTPNFFGSSYGSAYVNNNGNVTFDGALGTFTPFDLSTTNSAIIAPFFADVDTNAPGSDEVTYGNATYGDRAAFCVNWTGVAGGVGYYPARDDKLNSFQLLLVDRSDTGAGNFDIIMNYDKIRWETGGASGGTDGLGGDSARVGFSNGRPVNSFELPGSAVNGAFLDSNPETGLIYNSRDSLQLGRYAFEVRNGDAPVGGTISGGVFENSVDPNNALPGSLVQVCDSDNSCLTSSTNSAGEYSVSGLFDGDYEVRAFPPGGSNLQQNEIGPITLSNGETLEDQDVVLTGPTPPPEDTSLDGGIGETGDGIPVVIVGQPLQLQTTGCEGGAATYEVTGTYGGSINGTMTEGPPGTYTANFSIPFTGPAAITITIDCPGADDETIEFDIYIDPSGNVRDTDGDPIEGATATLFRSDSEAGPFTQVPDGDPIMSPSNRDNPDLTDADGHFGWLTIAGYYIVRAEMADCHAPGDESQTFVETDVLPVPPEQVGLELILDCPNTDDTPPVLDLPDNMTVEAEDSNGAEVTFTATATDEDPANPEVACTPASGSTFPIGTTTVECSAEDAAGNPAEGSFEVTVQDSTKPVLDLPDGISVEATSSNGATVNYEATATDTVDGDVDVTCDPASGGTFPLGEHTVNCSATDSAGNTAEGSFQVVVADSTDPTIDCDDPDGLWHNNNVDIDCTASDFFLDGGASFILSTNVPEGEENGNAETNSREVCDTSNNCATAGPISGNKIDRKDPEITIRKPEDGARYMSGQNVAADYDCADGGSGEDKCEGPVADGANIDTGSFGNKTFMVTARDKAGNEASASHGYSVAYDFKGFYWPVKNHPQMNVVRAGNPVLIWFSLGSDQGPDVLADDYPKSKQIDCNSPTQEIDGSEEGSEETTPVYNKDAKNYKDGLYHQSGSEYYLYGWKTNKKWAGTCRQFVIKLDDGTLHRANFQFPAKKGGDD